MTALLIGMVLCLVAVPVMAGDLSTDPQEATRLAALGLHDRIEPGLLIRMEATRGVDRAVGGHGGVSRWYWNATVPERYPVRAYQLRPNGPNLVLGQPARNFVRVWAHWRPVARLFRGFGILMFGRCGC